MHIGGACSKRVTRGDEPSAAGHGVSPVIDSPWGTSGTSSAGGGSVAVDALDDGSEVGGVVAVVPLDVSPSPPPSAAHTARPVAAKQTPPTPMATRRWARRAAASRSRRGSACLRPAALAGPAIRG
jgi:hypothetical protein